MTTPPLQSKFRGCMLGTMIGDVIGAVVETESPQYIAQQYGTIEAILLENEIPQLSEPKWEVGHFTDDTQMSIAVAEWLLSDPERRPERLLELFANHHENWRRYGPGCARILSLVPEYRDNWQALGTIMFPQGSYGNGSAMRVAPIGLRFHDELNALLETAILSSKTTHSHPLALQGAVLQACAVATALRIENIDPTRFVHTLRVALDKFTDMSVDTEDFNRAFDVIEEAIQLKAPADEVSTIIGTGIEVYEAVPMAVYCFLSNMKSFEAAIHDAVFIGGDTDTIASMTGAMAGAYHGEAAIPSAWIDAVREPQYTPDEMRRLADELHAASLSPLDPPTDQDSI